MIISNKGMTVIKVIKGSREDVFVDFAVVVHSLKGALVEGGMSSDKAEALIMDMVKIGFEDEENECSGSKQRKDTIDEAVDRLFDAIFHNASKEE